MNHADGSGHDGRRPPLLGKPKQKNRFFREFRENKGQKKDKRTGIIVGAQAPAPPFSHNQTKQQTTKKDRHHRWHGSSRTRASSAPHPQDGPRDKEALQRCDYLEEVASGTK
jgi:hypothetical protein